MYKPIVLLFVGLILSSPVFSAEASEGSSTCRAESSRLHYLACQDAESAGWDLWTLNSSEGDRKLYFAKKQAREPVWFLGREISPAIAMVADRGEVKFSISFFEDVFKFSGSNEKVLLRVDIKDVIALSPDLNERASNVTIEDGELIDKLRKGTRLLVLANLYGVDRQVFEFRLAGFESAYQWCLATKKFSENQGK